MKNRCVILLGLVLSVFLLIGNSEAILLGSVDTDLGVQITINDGIGNSGGSLPDGIAREDNETEIGTVASQKWDLEGMFWNKVKVLFPSVTYLSEIPMFWISLEMMLQLMLLLELLEISRVPVLPLIS